MTALDFMRAILADPDDDTPRLAYADFLDENAVSVECPRCHGAGWYDREQGDSEMSCRTCYGTGSVSDGQGERAEFIRLQIELALIGGCPTGSNEPFSSIFCRIGDVGCRRCTIRRRERELLQAHYRDWWPQGFEPNRGYSFKVEPPRVTLITGDGHWCNAVTRRGFVEILTCTAADWLDNADKLSWWPGEKCRECEDGQSLRHLSRNSNGWFSVRAICPTCHGTGERPCQPTAQPVREVRLTTFPQWALWFEPHEDHTPETTRVAHLRQLKRQWDFIDFSLPD